MSTWGIDAWDNDHAADWFGDLLAKTELAKRVEEALNLDASDNPEVVRAAAYVMIALGRNYIWPVDVLDKHLALAISKLEELKTLYDQEDALDIVDAIDTEIEQLESRL